MHPVLRALLKSSHTRTALLCGLVGCGLSLLILLRVFIAEITAGFIAEITEGFMVGALLLESLGCESLSPLWWSMELVSTRCSSI